MKRNEMQKEWGQRLLVEVEEVEGHNDSAVVEAQVAANCADLLDMLAELGELLAKRRAIAIRHLDREGMSQEQIAVALGLSRQRISQILNR